MDESQIVSPQASSQCSQNRTRLRPGQKWGAIVAIICVVAGALIWTTRMANDKERRQQTRMHLQEILSGFLGYQSVFDHLPFPIRRAPAGQSQEKYGQNGTGRPLYSWRVEIVPYLESWHGSWDKSQPWDSPANRELLELSGFYSYDQSFFSRRASEANNESFPETNAVAVTGPGTAFGDGKEPPMSLKDVPPNTILVVECWASGIPWPAPGDYDIRTMPQTINAPDGKGISSRCPGGFFVIFADGVWRLSDKVPFETLKKFFMVADVKKNDREKLLGPYVLDRAP